jgi:hypothetical protein
LFFFVYDLWFGLVRIGNWWRVELDSCHTSGSIGPKAPPEQKAATKNNSVCWKVITFISLKLLHFDLFGKDNYSVSLNSSGFV